MKYKQKTEEQQLNKTTEIRQLSAQTEQYQNLANQVLERLNKTDSRTDLIKDILFLVKAATGFEAIGIRLREGEDFPYYETIGFSKEFVKGERYLCVRDQTGRIIRDSAGHPYLECMCGNVLCGRTDPSFPFFTEGGSFWTNSTTELLASTTEEDRQGRTRNRCNSAGYESVALIPLRHDNETIGLLQLNDSRKNLFTTNLIRFFEEVGSSLAEVFRLKQREDNNLQPEKNFDTIGETMITYHDKDFNIISANKAAKEMLGLPSLIGTELKCYKYYHGKDSPPEQCPSCKCLLSGEPVFFEIYEPHLHKCIQIRAFPQFYDNNEYKGLIHFVRDITHESGLSDNKNCKRIDTKISAKVTIDSKYYEGTIGNLSEEGLFEIAFIDLEVSDFVPEKIIRVKFHEPSGEELNLECKIVWLRLNRDNPDSLTYCMGMGIISPPASYKKFVKLSNDSKYLL
jgi:GAF domain-containing protein